MRDRFSGLLGNQDLNAIPGAPMQRDLHATRKIAAEIGAIHFRLPLIDAEFHRVILGSAG